MRDRWLWSACAVYAAIFTWLGYIKYSTHHNLVDFGIFAQTTASAFGCFCNPVEGSHWAFHFSPILYLPGAILALWKSPLVLIALQSIACALAAPPIYAIVRSRKSLVEARFAALVALLYPPLAGLAFVDFHENAFAPAAIAWLLWAFDAGYLGVAAIAAAVALSIKEDQALFLAIAGVLGTIAYRGKKQWFAAAVTCVSIAVAIGFFFIIQPHAIAGNTHWQPTRFYNWTSDDIHTLFFNGIAERVGFLLLAFAPLAFAPFGSRWFLLALAPLAEVLFSSMSTTYTMGTHYAGAWAGYVLVAFAMSIRDCLSFSKVRRAFTWSIIFAGIIFAVANPLHPRLNLRPIQPRDVALDTFLAQIPPNEEVATQEEAYTHLALTDPNATVFPELATAPLSTCYALVDEDFPDSPRLQEYGPALAVYEQNGILRVAKNLDAIVLYSNSRSASIDARGQSCEAGTIR